MSNKTHSIELRKIATSLNSIVPVQAHFFLQGGMLQNVKLAKTKEQDKNEWHVTIQDSNSQLFTLIEEWVFAYFNNKTAPHLQVAYPPFAFTKLVLEELRSIPFGTTLSYKTVAERIGHEGSYRAVAGACSRNLVPLVIPCHRVIANDGSLGGFSAGEGVGLKNELLLLENMIINKKN